MLATAPLDALRSPTFDPSGQDVPEAQREEAEAVRLALAEGRVARVRLALGALHRLLKNPDDTRQVFILNIALGARHLPKLVTRFLSDERGVALLTERAAIDSQHVDYDALRALPPDTLGGAYARFLDDNGLDPDLFQAPPGMPAAVGYVLKRMRQTHDIWHVVTGYQTDIPGELSILAFIYGQTGAPSIRLLVTVGALRFSLEHRSIFAKVWQGYRRGRDTPFLGNVRWESRWHMPLADVRRELAVC